MSKLSSRLADLPLSRHHELLLLLEIDRGDLAEDRQRDLFDLVVGTGPDLVSKRLGFHI